MPIRAAFRSRQQAMTGSSDFLTAWSLWMLKKDESPSMTISFGFFASTVATRRPTSRGREKFSVTRCTFPMSAPPATNRPLRVRAESSVVQIRIEPLCLVPQGMARPEARRMPREQMMVVLPTPGLPSAIVYSHSGMRCRRSHSCGPSSTLSQSAQASGVSMSGLGFGGEPPPYVDPDQHVKR